MIPPSWPPIGFNLFAAILAKAAPPALWNKYGHVSINCYVRGQTRTPILMQKLTIEISFSDPDIGQKGHTESFDVQDDLNYSGWDYLARHMFRECRMEVLYRTHRQQLPRFEGFSDANDWSPSQTAISDLNRWAAHTNTAEAWLQIQNAFHETAHLLAQSQAYKDLEGIEKDEEQQLLLHIIKMQFFNSATYFISKIEDLFLLLLFVNSECSLIPTVDVRKKDWPREITRGAIHRGLKLRKSELCCSRFRRTNPYLNSLTDDEYRTVRSVLKKLGSANSVRTIRNYRNAVAHRGLPAVDRPSLSPTFRFPEKHGSGISLGFGGGPAVEYSFADIYKHAVTALKHCETQLRRIKAIPILTPR